jgi:hypothetical protein
MSITAMKPNGGTPFEQISRANKRPPAPRPHVRRVPPRAAQQRSTPEAPPRSLVQRMEALQRANDIRSRRAQLKRDLKARRKTLAPLLLDPPAYIETAKVFDVMVAVPKYGRVKVNKILSTCRISPSKTIGGLSQRQRLELVETLERR